MIEQGFDKQVGRRTDIDGADSSMAATGLNNNHSNNAGSSRTNQALMNRFQRRLEEQRPTYKYEQVPSLKTKKKNSF